MPQGRASRTACSAPNVGRGSVWHPDHHDHLHSPKAGPRQASPSGVAALCPLSSPPSTGQPGPFHDPYPAPWPLHPPAAQRSGQVAPLDSRA